MIKIDGEDIKKKLLKICDTIIELYSEAIYEYTFKRDAQIYQECTKLLEHISMTIDDTNQLVDLENVIDKITKLTYPRLQRDFKEVMSWLLFIFDLQIKIS